MRPINPGGLFVSELLLLVDVIVDCCIFDEVEATQLDDTLDDDVTVDEL